MTRVWAALALLAAILTLAFTEYKMCGELSSELFELTEQTENALQSGESVQQLCIKMKSIWTGKKNKAEMFINHSDADNIDDLLEEMIRYSQSGDNSRLYTDCGLLKNRLLSLRETECVNWHNVL